MPNDQIVKPQYGVSCFSDLPAIIQNLLDAGRPSPLAADLLGDLEGEYQTVVLFLIDSFGWRFIDRFRDRYPQLLSRATKITSQFPSTTSAHITCIHTGLPVGQSGIYEWMYYEPQLDAIIVEFDRLVQRRPTQRLAQVTSAVPLTDGEKDALRAKVKESFGADLEFQFDVDASLIGGVYLRVGDQIIDGSVAGKLAAMRDHLVA